MDVFSLRDAVVRDYRRFATSFTAIDAEDIRRQVEAIYSEDRYWPEPLIQVNPSYKRTTSVDQLVGGGVLDPRCAEIFRSSPTADAPRGLSPARWGEGPVVDWLFPRVLELTYTAHDLEPFARDCGYDGPPFRWDSGRRFRLRAELDAAFFHLYGVSRDDADYILETFPIVRKNDEKAHGEFRTKRAILEVYDALATAIRTGQPYRSPVIDTPNAGARR